MLGAKLLNRIDLHGTCVSDEGIAPLNSLPNLGTLDVSQTEVTNPGIVKLPGVKNWDVFYRDRDDFPPHILSYVP